MSPRPRKLVTVRGNPASNSFKPAGIPGRDLEKVVLSKAEFETIRLKDFNGLDQSECADKMGISQPTFHRLLIEARGKIADALVNGKAIIFEDTY